MFTVQDSIAGLMMSKPRFGYTNPTLLPPLRCAYLASRLAL
jgi:hypothetical protein